MYDFFVIMCSSRFTEDDLWFAREIHQNRKRFYFVRTKADIDVKNDSEDYPQTHNEQALLSQMRDDCTAELVKAGFADPLVFLVCKNPSLYDFPELDAKLISELPELKREAALLSLQSTSEKVFAEKSKQLKKRSWLVALGSGVGGLVPLPGVSFAIDTGILISEYKVYKKAYGLDDEGLEQLSECAHVSKDLLVKTISSNFWFNLTAGGVIRATGALGVGIALEEGLKFIPIPIVTSIIGGALSFTTTKLFLHSTIISMETAALTVVKRAFSKACSKEL